MFRVLAALFLSLLAACTPAVSTQRVWVDSYYHSTVSGEPALYDGGTWIYEAPAYTLRYTLGMRAFLFTRAVERLVTRVFPTALNVSPTLSCLPVTTSLIGSSHAVISWCVGIG